MTHTNYLSKREKEVVGLLLQGKSNFEAGEIHRLDRRKPKGTRS